MLILVMMLVSLPVWGDIFVKQSPDGTLDYSDCPSGKGWNLYIKEKKPGADDLYTQEVITSVARRYGISPVIIRAIIEVESEMNEGAVSSKGAIGLMQVMPETARDMGIDDPWDTRQNIVAGTRYFARLLKHYKGDVRLALAAYNAGPGVVDRYRGIPPFEETREYVKRVMAFIEGNK
ncbi:MAG: lytic transglycosylase domain-containing protein [Deltaproteobacteria bacterium]|nr:lytic transglycosylase domain-containing protein [Deltaproteobacteria bacterium]